MHREHRERGVEGVISERKRLCDALHAGAARAAAGDHRHATLDGNDVRSVGS